METQKTVVIVGAGPAGLMAAEVIRAAGHQVHVYDAKPSACRKFLLAGVGGMNITHSEPYSAFITRYYDKAQWLNTAVSQFDADALRQWIHALGINTFVGSSGRVFPEGMKAAPLLRNWLTRLRESGVVFHMRHRLISIDTHRLAFEYGDDTLHVQADAVLLAMGGASWPKLGSDGAWQALLTEAGVRIHPLQSANCGFYSQWSEHLQTQHAGSPLKNVAFHFTSGDGTQIQRKGECIVTRDGMEGSLIYAFSKYLRDAINQTGHAELRIDLLPEQTSEQLIRKLQVGQGKDSFSKYLKRTIGLCGVKKALLYECADRQHLRTPQALVACLKSLPVRFCRVKPIDEAISSAGGVCESSVNQQLMLKELPGVFCAGEMLDWEAPTGGYLLTACFATGRLAAQGVCDYLSPPHGD